MNPALPKKHNLGIVKKWWGVLLLLKIYTTEI